ncbi:hypothetical protein T09_1788 [Trichinella sp. T9]|nr:hypothetical protein T09_1788 [Trichinella sp. T9]
MDRTTGAVMSARAREKSKKLIIGKERLNRLFEELDQLCVGPAEVLEIGEQISMIERLFRETDALQVELELNLEEEERRMAEEDWSKYRKGFRERKVRALALMQSKESDCSGRLDDQGIDLRSGPEMVPAATSMHELAARLPRCDLLTSRSFFDYRVHQRKDLSNAAKLTYLRGCLTGKAADVISSLSSSNADYEVALNRLREEFDRPAKVIRHQIKKLVQTPPKDVGLRSQHAGKRYELEAMTAPVLCEDLWQTPVSPNDWPHLQSLNLTREVGELTPVHVIIGLDSYFRFLGRQVIRGGDGDPVAVETRLGWIICVPAASSRDRECRVHCIRTDDRLNAALRKFWELEAIGILPPETESGQTEMERRFKESLSFDGNRYSVGLLWKPGMASLPNNYATAIRRYRSLEKRLSRDSGLDEDYTTVMQSYLDNGWAEEAPASKTPGKTWYLPHHTVYQQGTTGRKCRIVFDGSAVHRGTSLNDHLESGPNLHVDLGILLRFRRFRVGLQADIEKMYLQVGLHPEDRDTCRFLWRGAGGGKAPREYRLTRVCFGLTCSPFLAIQTIRTHAEKSQHAGDKTARLITSNMYVDDLVLSCDSIEEAKKLVQESKSLFGKGGFNLTGFVSNCSSVVGYDGALPFGKDPKPAGRLLKTLGVLWDTESDQLSFRQPEVDAEEQDTKRTLLSLAATIFDPLGYLTPFTVRAKMLLQLLWQEGTSWDDPLPVPVEAVWRNWKGELADLSQVSIDRACIQCSLMELVYISVSQPGGRAPLGRRRKVPGGGVRSRNF